MRSTVLACVAAATGCVDAPPRAIVHARSSAVGLGRAVLVLPTRCTSELGAYDCAPGSYEKPTAFGAPPDSYAVLIDPALRLKLEFAGYTLAEAAAMQVTSGDRVDTRTTTTADDRLPQSGTGTRVTPGIPLASLDAADLVAVARSLQLAGIVSSALRVLPAPHGGKRFELTVALHELDRPEPVWSVTCGELYLGNDATSARLGNCVGNGILAAFAPDNLMSKPL